MMADQGGGNRIAGVVPAIVVDNNDPTGRYRVKVLFPQWLCAAASYTNNADKEDFLSPWARVVTFMGGPDRGAYFLPEVDDEVLVCFENGDIRFPYIVGSLWNGVDKPTQDNSGEATNSFRSIRSRSGHTLTFLDKADDKHDKLLLQTATEAGKMGVTDPADRKGHFIVLDQSGEKIEIRDTTKKLSITLDSSKGEITIETTGGNMKLLASETLSIECKKLEVKAETSVEIEAGTSMKQKAGQGIEVDGGPRIRQKASMIELN